MRIVSAAVAFVLLFPPISRAQQSDPGPGHQRESVLRAAGEVMQQARFCTLVTVGEDGHPQARIVDPFAPEEGMVVWMATRSATRKVAQIRRDSRVTLLCFDTQAMGYVSLLGTAQLVDDADEKAARWKEEWAAFYSDRHRGDDYLLIRMQPASMEIVSAAHGILSDPETWRPVQLVFP